MPNHKAYFDHDSAAIVVGARNAAMAAAFARELAATVDDVPHGWRAAVLFRVIEREGEDVATVNLTELDMAKQSIEESTGLRPRPAISTHSSAN